MSTAGDSASEFNLGCEAITLNSISPFPLSLWLVITVASAQGIDVSSGIRSLIDSERAFCKAAIERGTHDAFLEYLAEDGVIFRPHPVNGKEWFREHPSSPGVLTWEPRKAEVSSSGDLGYTTGPWQFRKDSLRSEPVSYGNYVSVWKKQADAVWKLVLDVGTVNPKPEPATTPLPSQRDHLRNAGGRSAKVDIDAERRRLVAADSNLSRSLREGATATIFRQLTDDVTFLRNEKQPLIGRRAARVVLPERSGQFTANVTRAEVSGAGDFGYTYGTYEAKGSGLGTNASEQGNYVRIWKIQIDGSWKLTLDIHVPVPREVKKS